MQGRDVIQGWLNRVFYFLVIVIGLNDEYIIYVNLEFFYEICYIKVGLEGCFGIWIVIYKNDRSLEGLLLFLWGKSFVEEGC